MAAIGVPRSEAETAGDVALFSAFTISATVWLLIATAVGLLLSFKFPYPDLAASPYLSFGRLRAIHTNGTFYGFASVALTGIAMYVAARSSGITLWGKKYAWAALWCYNAAATLGTITLDLGINNGDQEYREWVWWVALFFIAAVVLSAMSIIGTVAKRTERDVYISNWYTIGAYSFTAILGVTAGIPFYQHGLGQVAVQGFYMHNAVGMWFTFLALGTTYYALPKLLNRPIYSYALGILGFWTNLIFYPIIGAHHFEFSPLPWWFQTLAIVFSVGMLVPVFAGSGNFLLTMRGRWERIRRSAALPFIFVGVLYYFLGSFQGTIEALRSLQTIWHLTSYTVGHSHATMYGFITFIVWGCIYGLLPKATGKEPNPVASGLHFWLATIGVTLYVLALSVGGTLQGIDWAQGDPFIASVQSAAPYWVARSVGGTMMFLAHLLFAYNVYLMTIGPLPRASAALPPPENMPGMKRGMNNVVVLVGGPFIIYAALAVLMGVLPGFVLSQTPPGPGVMPLSARAQRGRDVYVAEGCAYCHTQQVRPLKQDLVFGRPSTACDYAYSTPQLLGSERNGPDLSNIGSRQPSDQWQFIHLYEPRALVSMSIMPPYRWLFRLKPRAEPGDIVVPVPAGYAPRTGVVVTTQEARDLVAYLMSLKQASLVGGRKR